MENEINYLKKKIELIQSDIDYNTKDVATCEDVYDRAWYNGLIEYSETEKEYLNNILKLVTKYSSI